MNADHGLGEYVGRWAIRSATRPAVWPFVCHAVIEILPTTTPAQLFVRVHTAGGALLRGYSAACTPRGSGLALTGIECNGRAYNLTLVPVAGDDGLRGLAGTWTDAGGGAAAVTEGIWMAESEEHRAEDLVAREAFVRRCAMIA